VADEAYKKPLTTIIGYLIQQLLVIRRSVPSRPEDRKLPHGVVSAPSLPTFRRRLKTFVFQKSYPDVII